MEDISLTELAALARTQRNLSAQKPLNTSNLNGKRVRFSGYLASLQYHLVQPEQLLGTFAAEISPTEGNDKFVVWTMPSQDSKSLELPVGTMVEVVATLRKPMFGKLVGEQAQMRLTNLPT